MKHFGLPHFIEPAIYWLKLESIQVSSAPALHAKEPPDFEEALANVYLSAFKIAWMVVATARGVLQVAENVGNIPCGGWGCQLFGFLFRQIGFVLHEPMLLNLIAP